MQPTFSLCYTSVRAAVIPEVVNLWLSKADHPEAVEVVVSVDADRQDTVASAASVEGAIVKIQTEAPFDCVKGWNLAASASTGKILIAVADDFMPCQGWDTKIAWVKEGRWADENWAVHCEDGYVHDIAVLAIITRKRYEKFGYLFYPGYESMFSDTEHTEVAYREGRMIEAKHILIEHLHPDCNKRPRDSHDVHHASKDRWNRGEMLFNYRKHQGFPNDTGLGLNVQVEAPTEKYGTYAVYIQANRNDICLDEVVQRMYDEGLRNFFFCIPTEYWSGKPTPGAYIDEVLASAQTVKSFPGTHVFVNVFDISDYRFEGDSRIAVETRVRNDSLAWVRQAGYKDILVVDSDELWPVGSMEIIKEVVDKSKPASKSLPMVPVAGFPGYPVENAVDRCVSYVGQGCIFRDCRTPVTSHVTYENRFFVYHFTSTRRSLEETIQKHKESGHYDDTDYDFEGWIKDVLPNIRPGAKDVHMYKHYSTWPSVRNWTADDERNIPSTIWPYLGKVQ
jgi:hypothetical protein